MESIMVDHGPRLTAGALVATVRCLWLAHEQRLDAVRVLSMTNPRARPPDIARELGIPAATARRRPYRRVAGGLEER